MVEPNNNRLALVFKTSQAFLEWFEKMSPLTWSVAAGILDNNCKCAIFSALETGDKAESERTGWPAPLHCTRVDISRETLVSGNYIHFAV